jgi:integrase
MPVYKKGQQWRVVIWFKGKRHDFVLSGTKEEAREYESTKRVELQSSDPEALLRDVPKFKDFAEGPYRTHAKAHLKKRVWTNRTYTLATLIDHFGSTKINAIHVAKIEAYKHGRIEKKIKASTINDELKVLRAVLSYARELGIRTADSMIKNLPTRGISRKVTYWNRTQVGALLDSIRKNSREIEPLVVFLLNTGVRKGEALALEWDNIDLTRGIIRIEPSEEWQPKDGEARTIPISDHLRPYLIRHRAEARHVFRSRSGERYAFWPQRAFDRAREAAGLIGGPHTARHTFATHFLYKTPDLYLLGKILGHSTAYVTELYSHLLPDHLERARNVVSFGLLEPAKTMKERAA